jgi:hypothetical protein
MDREITFQNWHSITDKRDDQYNDGQIKTMLGFTGTGLNESNVMY